jgi:hypothetical protein
LKKALYTLLLITICSFGYSQNATEVPESIKSKFALQNPNAQNVKWTAFKTDCMVTYSVNNLYNESYYKMNGDLILTACNLKEDQLPQKTNQYLYSIRENTKIDLIGRAIDSKNDTTYQVKGEEFKKKRRKTKYKAINLNFNNKGDLISEGRCFYTRFPYLSRKEKIK